MGKARTRGKMAASQKGQRQVGRKRGAAKTKRGRAAGGAGTKRKGASPRETELGGSRGGASPRIRIKIGRGPTRDRDEAEPETTTTTAARRNRRKLFRSVDYKRVGLDWPTSSPAIGSLSENERIRCAMRDIGLGKFRFVSRAAAYWRVHAAKLYRRHSGEVPLEARRGPKKVLTEADESSLIDWVVGSGRRGFPVAPGMVCDAVKCSFRKEGNPFTNDRPSHTWYHKFVRRYPRLQRGLRMSRLTAICRADPTKAAVSQWLAELWRCMAELGLADKPGQIWTCGQTGFEMNRRTERIALTFSRKGGKGLAAEDYEDYDPRQEVDVHVCASAAGELLPPFLVCKGFQGFSKGCSLLEGAPRGSGKLLLDGQSESPDIFGYWIKNHLVPRLGEERPVLLLLDSEESDISYEAFAASSKHNIHLFRIPPQATALLHPLEIVGEEGPLKSRWLTQWVKRNRHMPVNAKTVGCLIGEAWSSATADPEAVRSCFIQSGIYPPDREMVDDEHLPAGNLEFLAAVNQSDDENDPYDDTDEDSGAGAPDGDSGSSSLGKDLAKSECLPEHKQPIAALLLFQELDDSLDKATRELYRTCAESGIELGLEAPMFAVWRRLYTEAFKNDPNVPLTSVEEVVVTTSSSASADPEEKAGAGREADPTALVAEGSTETTVCPVCGEHFGEDDGEWIACDGSCQQWFHVNCLPPELVTPAMLEEKEMFCPQCSKLRKDEDD